MSWPPIRILVVIGVAAAILSVAMVPITVVAPVDGEPRTGWDRIPLAAHSTIVVDQTGLGQSVMSLPRLELPEVFDPDSAIVDTGPFQILDDDLTMQTESPGELVIEGVFGDAALDVLLMTPPVRVTVTRNDGSSRTEDAFDSGDLDTGSRDLEVPSMSEAQVRKMSYLFRTPDSERTDQIYVGEAPLDDEAGAATGSLLWAATKTASRAWLLVLGAWALISACSITGGVILRLFGIDRGPPSVAAGLGFGLMAIVTNTLAYFVDIRWVTVGVLAGVVVLLSVGFRLGLLGGAIQSWLAGLKATLVVAPLAVFAFFPILAWGPWFAGNFKTDIFEYATLSSFLQDHSLFDLRDLPEAQASGNITSGAGFVWRSIDSVVASFVSNLGGLNTIAGFTILGLVLMMLFGIGVTDLAGGLGKARFLVVTAALLNPLFTSLYIENYFSQYFLVALVPAFLATLGFLVVTISDRLPMIGASLALSAQAAAMIAVYPYFFAVIGVAALLGVLTFRQHRRAIRIALIQVLLMTAVMVNLALLTVVQFGETSVFGQGLDAITRNVLLSGLDRAAVVEVLSGLRSYHWRDHALSLDGLGEIGSIVAQWARVAVAPSGWWIALGLAAIVGLGLVTDFRKTFSSLTARVTLAVFGAWIAFGGLYLALDRPYISLKGLWTAGALIPLVVTCLHWRPRWQRTAFGCVGVLALIWATTVTADRINWILPNPGSEVRSSHVAAAPELVRVERLLAATDDPVSVVRGEQPLKGSDLDRVLTAHSTILVRDHDLSCTNCSGFNPPERVDCAVAHDGVLIVIGLSSQSLICDLPIDDSGLFVEIHRR